MSSVNITNKTEFQIFKYKKINKVNFTYVWVLIKKINYFFKKINVLLINYSFKINYIYIYVLLYNYLQKKIIKIIIKKDIVKTNQLLFLFITVLANLFNYLFLLIKYYLLIKECFYSIMDKYYLQFFFNDKYLLKNKKVELKLLFFSVYSKFLSILLNIDIKKKTKGNELFFIYNILLISHLINLQWNNFTVQLNNLILFKFNKSFFKFIINIRYTLYILYFSELFKNSSILLYFLTSLIFKQKSIFNLNIIKIISKFLKYIKYFLINNYIYFKGIKLFISGKLTKLLRSKKYSYTLGQISSQSHVNLISYSNKSFIIRAGLINFKLWIYF